MSKRLRRRGSNSKKVSSQISPSQLLSALAGREGELSKKLQTQSAISADPTRLQLEAMSHKISADMLGGLSLIAMLLEANNALLEEAIGATPSAANEREKGENSHVES